MNSDQKANSTDSSSRGAQGEIEPRTHALETEINSFCKSFRLTPRESEVVGVLAEGVVRIKDIADRLSLSPNTVNNHVNSIFLKTKTRSKSQLLAMLLNRISEDLLWARWMSQTPKLLCLMENVNDATVWKSELEKQRLKVCVADLRGDWKSEVEWFQPHFVLVDLDGGQACKDVLGKVKAVSNAQVLLLKSSFHAEDRSCAMEDGAVDLVVKPLDPQQLSLLVFCHHIERDDERLKFIESQVPEKKSVQSAQVRIPLAKEAWGRGGVFVSQPVLRQAFTSSIAPGDWVEFQTQRPHTQASHPVIVRGHVAWVRQEPAGGRAPGAGIRIMSMSDGQASADGSSASVQVPGWRELAAPYIPAGPSVQ